MNRWILNPAISSIKFLKTFLFSRIHFWVELNFDHGVTDPLVYLKSTAFFISFVVELKWPLTCEVKLYSCCYL